MAMVRELNQHGFKLTATNPTVHCRVFEDNSGALEIAKAPRMRPRTKYLNLAYHHFRHHVENGDVSIHPIGTDAQCADTLTKANDATTLQRHRLKISGW
jgi:hypothetical protein